MDGPGSNGSSGSGGGTGHASGMFAGGAATAAASAAAAASVLRFNVAGAGLAGGHVHALDSPLPTYGSLKKGVNTVLLDMTSMCKR